MVTLAWSKPASIACTKNIYQSTVSTFTSPMFERLVPVTNLLKLDPLLVCSEPHMSAKSRRRSNDTQTRTVSRTVCADHIQIGAA